MKKSNSSTSKVLTKPSPNKVSPSKVAPEDKKKAKVIVLSNGKKVDLETISKGIAIPKGKDYVSLNKGNLSETHLMKLKNVANSFKNIKAKGIGNKQIKALETISNLSKELTPKDIAIMSNDLKKALKANPNNPELLKYYEQLAAFTMLFDDMLMASKERKLLAINIEEEFDNFLRNCSKSGSQQTRDRYEGHVKRFMKWVKDNTKLDLLHLTPKHAQDYNNYLSKLKSKHGTTKLANHSVNGHLTGVMAFYKYLNRQYPVVERIFLGINRPVSQNSKPINIPTSKDAKAIMKHLYSVESQIALPMELALRTGFRVGAFETLSFDNRGNFIIEWTKGKRLTGNFDRFDYTGNGKPLFKGVWKYSLIDLIHSKFGKFKGRITPFTDKCFTSENMRKNFVNITKRLCAKGIIEYAYSFHDLRHYFANLYYKISGHDIMLLNTLIGHAGLNTTAHYLQEQTLNSPRSNWK